MDFGGWSFSAPPCWPGRAAGPLALLLLRMLRRWWELAAIFPPPQTPFLGFESTFVLLGGGSPFKGSCPEREWSWAGQRRWEALGLAAGVLCASTSHLRAAHVGVTKKVDFREPKLLTDSGGGGFQSQTAYLFWWWLISGNPNCLPIRE